MQEYIDILLERALDIGLSEFDFWDMTVGEIVRKIESYNRCFMAKSKEKATYDYIQATLIVKGVSICLGSKEKFPSIQEAYGELFNDEIEKQREMAEAKQAELSILRFKQFAQTYNKNFKNKEVRDN